METLYDGYVVNAIMDACYRSSQSHGWVPVQLDDWRGTGVPRVDRQAATLDGHAVVKEEQMPDGRRKVILSDPDSGRISERIVD
jgi:hypothetical protein